jgi:predicted PurR-regulated permease PerM
MPETKVPRFFLALMLIATVLLAMVIRPVLTELILAAVLAGVLWPVQRRLARALGGRRSLAAGILCVAVVLLLLGPIAAMLAFVVSDGSDGVAFVTNALQSEDVKNLVARLPEGAQRAVNDAIERLPRNAGELMSALNVQADGETAATVGRALSRTGSFVFHTVLMIIALFFMLVSGDDLVRWIDQISPLRRGRTRELLTTFGRVSYAVIVSAVVTAAVQAGAALVGYLIAQVPSPFFFTLVTFFVAFVPAIGAAVVCLFCAALLLLTGHPYMAIFLAAWGIVVVGVVDNLVKPLLIKRGMEIHGAVVFFALIGGLAAFGAIGLLLGPLLVAFFLAVLRIYHEDYTPEDTHVPAVPGIPEEEQATPTVEGAPAETKVEA